MKLSTRARDALRSMFAIAQAAKEKNGAVSLEKLAAATKISKRYLEQLAIAEAR